MAGVRYEQATRIYPGTDAPAVDALDLSIPDGEFLVMVGPSGSGKTTALRMLAGLEEVDAGAIFIGERDVTDVAPKSRDVAMVFQNYALYPYLTVEANIGFPLKLARVDKTERAKRVREVARMLDLEPYLGRKPGQLSGGQRQRVAMGRAIIREPSVFLMDEPLSNLDAKLRVQTRAEIASLQARLGVTTVYVTHDQSEAMTLGHRVAVLHDATLQQCDKPRVLYDRPANTFVAGFIGSPGMNLLTLPVGNGSVELGGVHVPVPSGRTSIVLGVRPESMHIAAEGLAAEVEIVEEIGADAFVYCQSEVGRLVARTETRKAPGRGERVALRPSADDAHLFDAEAGTRVD
ncbi:MAG TPA: ABC transporter ATP-binding protein [Gaiellaceae bacterium]|nr:ABC transporter ATP-binding protein [Gaiellaceae bacterium]